MGEEYCSARKFSNDLVNGTMISVPYCTRNMFHCKYAGCQEEDLVVCCLGSKIADDKKPVFDSSSIEDILPKLE